MTDVEVREDPAETVAERLVTAAREGLNIVLTGGSTPRRAYERASELGDDWGRAILWFGDERCVPPDHEHSNYGMVKAALLDRIAGPQPAVHRMEGERPPHDGARAYARVLAETFGEEEIPRFDVLLLGLGPDGHCASLFPDQDELDEEEAPVVGVESPGMAPLVPRITLTLPVLNAAREVIFLVAGADKADAVARAFGDAPPSRSVPASLVRPTDGTLTVFLDPAAASRL